MSDGTSGECTLLRPIFRLDGICLTDSTLYVIPYTTRSSPVPFRFVSFLCLRYPFFFRFLFFALLSSPLSLYLYLYLPILPTYFTSLSI